VAEIALSVVIPSYNEMVNLRKGVLDKIEHYLTRRDYSWEVIVVDDGSDDGSTEFVDAYAKEDGRFRLLKNNHSGKAGAVTAGMLEAKGKIRLFTDMDQATPIEEVENLLPYFDQGFDIVIGSRSERKGSPLTRRIMSESMILLRKALVGLYSIDDTQCGFKMFTKESADNLFNKISEMHGGFTKIHGSNVAAGFDVELLLLASKMHYKIKEVQVEWLYVETRRVSPVADSIHGVRDLLRIFFNKYSGKYRV
jgi:dolichyl-phosphate beta-glucosyltransferase